MTGRQPRQVTAEEAAAHARLDAEFEAKLVEMQQQQQAARLNKGFQQSTRAHDSRVAHTRPATTAPTRAAPGVRLGRLHLVDGVVPSRRQAIHPSPVYPQPASHRWGGMWRRAGHGGATVAQGHRGSSSQ
jgi:hypothetical protein